MGARVEIRVVVKPGRLDDAIADMEMANKITERLAGVRGQMFLTSQGTLAFGGATLTWDFPSEQAVGALNDAAANDPEYAELGARVTGADSAWVVPASREVHAQLV